LYPKRSCKTLKKKKRKEAEKMKDKTRWVISKSYAQKGPNPTDGLPGLTGIS